MVIMKTMRTTVVRNFIKNKKTIAIVICIAFLFSLTIPKDSYAYPDDQYLNCRVLTGNNLNTQNYSTYYSHPIRSYLTKTEDGYMRIQYRPKYANIWVFNYDNNFKLLAMKTVSLEKPILGAFYETSDYYFLISGSTNTNENENLEVMNVAKYDKSWNLIGSCGIKGANTVEPFYHGCCRVDSYGSYMVVRTCHKTYEWIDGLNHQTNVTLIVNIDDMEITDSQVLVSNEKTGYVAHSFNQFVKIDNNKIVAVDHGDSSPRAFVLINYPANISTGKFGFQNVQSTNVIKFPGVDGNNKTGASMGGFEISDTSYLMAGNAVKMDESFGIYNTRNVFLATVDKSTKNVTVTYFTDYAEGEETTSTPHLVKINNNKFMVIWPRGDKLYYLFVDGKGKKLTKIYTADGQLSDCDPIVNSGKVIWYTWKDGEVTFYQIPVSNPESIIKNSTVYGDDYQLQSYKDGVAHLKCSKCGDEKDLLIPTEFEVKYWKYNGEDKLHFIKPNRIHMEYDLQFTIGTLKYTSGDASLEKSKEMIIELEDPSAGIVDCSTLTIHWKKAGIQKFTVYPKYNKGAKQEFEIKVTKPLEGVSITAEKKDSYVYNSDVTFTAVANGGRGDIEYRFVLVDSTGKEEILRDYNYDQSFKWTMDKVGTFTIRVDAKDFLDDNKVCSGELKPFTVVKTGGGFDNSDGKNDKSSDNNNSNKNNVTDNKNSDKEKNSNKTSDGKTTDKTKNDNSKQSSSTAKNVSAKTLKMIKEAPKLKNVDKSIKKLADNSEVKGSKFSVLQLSAKKITGNQITLKWKKVSGAEKYIIYGNKCGKNNKYEKIATVKSGKSSYKVKKLADKSKIKKGTYYKFLVVAAAKDESGVSKAIATSKTVHLITSGKKKYTNYSKVKLNSKKKISLKVGKTSTIKARQVKKKGYKVNQHRKLSYESSNPKVATVAKNGKIKAKKKGSCIIYAYSQSGTFAKIKVTVK